MADFHPNGKTLRGRFSSRDPASGMKRAHHDVSDRPASPRHPQDIIIDHMSLMDGVEGAGRGASKRVPKISKKIQACKQGCPPRETQGVN